MDRDETMRRLDRISDMSDAEVAHAAKWVRDTAIAARMHITELRKTNQARKNRERNLQIELRKTNRE